MRKATEMPSAAEETCQDEVGLICGEHEDGDVLLGQRGDDGLGDLRHADSLRAAGGVAVGDHVERQPDGALHLEMLRGLELCVQSRGSESAREGRGTQCARLCAESYQST